MDNAANAANTEPTPLVTNASPDKTTRERTQIEFPYTDLGQAEELARQLMDRGGGSAEADQLASWMDQSAHGGTFRARLSAARMFGFINTEPGVIRITQDGRDVLDADRAAAVRVASFLRIPLFGAMFDKNKGHALPPAAAIERQMVELGVPTKQKERARQVFQKSASLAQFIDLASGRFTKPAVADRIKDVEVTRDQDNRRMGRGDDPPPPPPPPASEHHPFVAGLLSELPQINGYQAWKIEDQAEWLRAAASIFKLLSKQQGRITITVIQDNNTPTGANQSAQVSSDPSATP